MNFSLAVVGVAKVVIRPGTVESGARWIEFHDGKGVMQSVLVVGVGGKDPPEVEVIEAPTIDAVG